MAKPLQLREIRVYSSDLVTKNGLVAPGLAFHQTTHHVCEIFSLSLPGSYVLDGSSLVQITCGPRGSRPAYWQVLGSTEVFIDPFDFEAYLRMSGPEREELVLRCIEEKLVEIAQSVGADLNGIRMAATAVRTSGFVMEREVLKLRKRVPGKKTTIRVFRSFSSLHSEAWMAKVVDSGDAVSAVHLMYPPAALDRRQLFQKASIDAAAYVVLDRFGKETFRLPLVGA